VWVFLYGNEFILKNIIYEGDSKIKDSFIISFDKIITQLLDMSYFST
jgi:hypothetical protein